MSESNIEAVQAHAAPGLLTPDASVLVLTWVVFFLLLLVLQRFAWKPILNALDIREANIRTSIEKAEKIERDFAELEKNRQKLIDEAEEASRIILDESRKAALEAANIIENKAREKSKILFENAQREIKTEVENAQAMLRTESSRIAIRLAEKLIEENLDDEKNRKIINRCIKEI